MQGWVRDDEKGGTLVIFMDNCSGQNKNRMVLRLALYLVERDFFKTVRFEFLVRGHTKNPADRKFNILKKDYRKANVYTMESLVEVLNKNDEVTCIKVTPDDFADWDELLDKFYRSMPTGETHKNHRFIVSKDTGTTKMEIHESALQEDTPTVHEMKKTRNVNFNGRSREQALKELVPAQLVPPALKEIKQVELATKYGPLIPEEVKKVTKLYDMPTKEVIDRVNAQKNDKRKRKSDKDTATKPKKKGKNQKKEEQQQQSNEEEEEDAQVSEGVITLQTNQPQSQVAAAPFHYGMPMYTSLPNQPQGYNPYLNQFTFY